MSNNANYEQAMVSSMDYCKYWIERANKLEKEKSELEKENLDLKYKLEIVFKALLRKCSDETISKIKDMFVKEGVL